jgi:hypothetical protein
MNCFRSLERWDRGFESRSRHGCLYCVRLLCVYIVLHVGTGLATARSSRPSSPTDCVLDEETEKPAKAPTKWL